ncbi:Methyltransf_11 domain-containing protein [Frankia sp. Hr75.2]|nr:Methyltransf_11 domain-containing protein [Frankia sp. Hr75.2]
MTVGTVWPVRLNLGSGPKTVPGWTSIDRSPTILLERLGGARKLLFRAGIIESSHLNTWPREVVRRDIRRPLPYEPAEVDAIYSSHALEHLYLTEAEAVLAECFRVLRSGGTIRLALPDAQAFAEQLLSAPFSGANGRIFNERLHSHPDSPPGFLQWLRRRAGSSMHRWQPTESLLRELLTSAGFIDVQRRQFQTGEFPDLTLIEHRKDSLIVEATKP